MNIRYILLPLILISASSYADQQQDQIDATYRQNKQLEEQRVEEERQARYRENQQLDQQRVNTQRVDRARQDRQREDNARRR